MKEYTTFEDAELHTSFAYPIKIGGDAVGEMLSFLTSGCFSSK